MSEVSGVGSRVHLRPDDDESTTSIVARDTKVAIRGNDITWRQEKAAQQAHVGVIDALHIGHAGFEGAELSGAAHAGRAGVIGGAVGGLWLGVFEFKEMHEKRDAQATAITRDCAHVAVVGSLALPDCYKTKRFEKDFAHVSRTHGDAPAMLQKLDADPKGRALLQLHSDRGMHAAKDLMLSKATVEGFLNAHPKVAEQYRQDAAFREGFDAYLFTKANGSGREIATMEAGLIERDGWYAADHIAIRV